MISSIPKNKVNFQFVSFYKVSKINKTSTNSDKQFKDIKLFKALMTEFSLMKILMTFSNLSPLLLEKMPVLKNL